MLKVNENWAPNTHLALEKCPCHSSIICQKVFFQKNTYSDASIPATKVSPRKKKGH